MTQDEVSLEKLSESVYYQKYKQHFLKEISKKGAILDEKLQEILDIVNKDLEIIEVSPLEKRRIQLVVKLLLEKLEKRAVFTLF